MPFAAAAQELPSLSISDVTITEGHGFTTVAVFSVNLSAASADVVIVQFSSAGGTAVAGVDFATVGGSLTFDPGETSLTIGVLILGDRLDEPDESFTVSLANPVNAIISRGQATGLILDDDPPPTMTITDVSVLEGNSGTVSAVFDVRLSGPSGRTVTVDYATADGTALAGSDYQPAAGSLTFSPGVTNVTVTVLINGDVQNEHDESFVVNLSNVVNATLTDAQGGGTIRNNDAVPSLRINDLTVSEGNSGSSTASFLVTLSAASGLTVTVSYATAVGTATSGSDYTSASGTLTFPPGITSLSVPVTVNGDLLHEPDETFTVTLAGPANATIARAQATGTIQNDDPLPGLSVSDSTILEGDGGTKTSSFPVTLAGATEQTVTVSYTTVDGTATAGSDYAAASGTLTFLPGVASQSVTVTVNGDVLAEADETLYLRLSSPVNATLVRSQAALTIQNDDFLPRITIGNAMIQEGDTGPAQAVFTVSMSAAYPQAVTIQYATADGSARAGTDYVPAAGMVSFAPGVTSQTITVMVSGDTLDEEDETFAVVLSNPVNATIAAPGQAAGTIVDNDPMPAITVADVSVIEGDSGTGNASFTVTLSAPSGRSVSLAYSTSAGTASSSTDFRADSGTVVFGEGVTNQVITIPVYGDTLDEEDETFFLNISNPVHATLGRSQALGTIQDNDPVPSITVSDASVTEGNSGTVAAAFSVVLSAPSGRQVSVHYATASLTAVAGIDYVTTNGVLTFPAGATVQTVLVPVIGDVLSETNETFRVELSSPANATLSRNQAFGTILDDDALPSLSIPDVRLAEGHEGATNAVFVVTLSPSSGQAVRVDYTTRPGTALPGTDYGDASGTLTFAPGATSQTIQVPVLGERVYEPDEAFYVELTGPANATLGRSIATATIVNDDSQPAVSVSNVSTLEGNSGNTNAVFAVVLSNPSAFPVSVKFATTRGTADAGPDYYNTVGQLFFAPGVTLQEISVTVIGDLLNEVDETFYLDLSSPTNAWLAVTRAVGTIVNDDAPPGLTINDVSLVEGHSGGTNAIFTVALDYPSGKTVSVDYSTANGTAASSSDYAPRSGTLSFLPGITNLQVSVEINGDTLYEANETFYVNLTRATNGVLVRSQGLGTIQNDDTMPYLAIGDASVLEGDSGSVSLLFPLTLSAPCGLSVSATYSTANGTAVAGSDYTAASGSVTLAPGATTQSLAITVLGDNLIEANETVIVTLAGPVNAVLSRSQATGTIVDNESRVSAFTNSAVIAIPSVGEVSPYPSSIQLTGLPGTLSKVTVSLLGLTHALADDLDILLVGPSGQRVMVMSDAGGSDALSGVNLTFDDAAGGLLPDSSGFGSGTYRPTNYSPLEALPSPAPGPPYQTSFSELLGTSPNGTWSLYVDDDGFANGGTIAGGWRLSLTTTNLVCCSTGSEADVSVTMAASANPAFNGERLTYSLLVVNSGPAVATGVSVTQALPAGVQYVSATSTQGNCTESGGVLTCAVGNLAIGATARVHVTVLPPLVGTLFSSATVSTASSDGNLANNNASAQTIVIPAPPKLSVSSASVLEPSTTTTKLVFEVSLSYATNVTATVNYSTASGSALSGEDFLAVSGVLTFSPGVTRQYIEVEVNGDRTVEGDETFSVILSNPWNAGLLVSTGTGTIVNDDGVPGAVDRFVWDSISTAAYLQVPTAVTVRAVDVNGNPVSGYNGQVSFRGQTGTEIAARVLITEVNTGLDSVELANVTQMPIDLTGWQVYLYDWISWPEPILTYSFAPNTLCNPNEVFVLSEEGVYPGNYPGFYTGGSIAWGFDLLENQVAVLLRDAAGQIVDFMVAVDGLPTQIAVPRSIPTSQWSGAQLTGNTDPAKSYQRIGTTDRNDSSDWTTAAISIGSKNQGFTLPWGGPKAVAVSPTISASFVNGVWTGAIAPQQLGTNMYLVADDGQGHLGTSGQFTVIPVADLVVSSSASASLVPAGQNVTFTLWVTNKGPVSASAVVLTNVFAGQASYVSGTTTQGTVSRSGNTVSVNIGSLAVNAAARVTVVLQATTPGSMTNTAMASHALPDPDTGNNSVSTVVRVNFPPTITTIADQVVNEDTATAALQFTIADVESAAGSLTVSAGTLNTNLVAITNIVLGGAGGSRTITLTPIPNQFGVTTNTISVSDGMATASTSFVLTVQPVNDPPAFVKGANASALEDASAQTVSGWATGITAGPANESSQLLSFVVTNNNTGLFSTQPAVAPNGTLTFTPAANSNGTATVSVRLQDNGGVANGGVDSSPVQTFTITVTPVNDAPSFTKGGNQSVPEDAGPQTVSSWATAISPGPPDEAAQAVNFTVSNSNNGLFSAQPALSSGGTLTYTPAVNANGSATVTVVLRDTGGTANGGSDASAAQTFTISVTPVNDPPVLTALSDHTVNEGVLLSFNSSATDPDLPSDMLTFTLGPGAPAGATISSAGAFTWTPSEEQGPGTNTITVRVTDTAGSSDSRTFTVVVNEVNRPPSLPAQSPRTFAELALLSVANAASDPDIPANAVSYQLQNPPQGVSIDSSGVISWTPGETQGPGSYVITTIATDNGTPPLSATNTLNLTITEVNSVPALPAQSPRTINELTQLSVANPATDGDFPANTISYQLLSPPSGAAINAAGLITWSPTEAQGPGSYEIATVATDNGSPALSVTNKFTVTVNEVNTAPVLPAQVAQSVNELTVLRVTNTATDADLPASALTYQLMSPPSGAAISAVGVITWTPSEAQGPGTYKLTTVVSDNGSPSLSATNSFDVTVADVNTPPSLPSQPDRNVNELSPLAVDNGATDSDVPLNAISYQLISPPTGASINGSGLITWTPTEVQGPGSYTFTTVATDNGTPALSTTNSFQVTVAEVNSAPQLAVLGNRSVDELTQIVISNSATDADLPANALTYALENPPGGVAISGSGVITWTPTELQGPGTYSIKAVVTDSGTPALKATNTVTVVVNEVNTAPVLPAQSPRGVAEMTQLSVNNAATDLDLPANSLSYQLLGAPAGASISSSGLITWTPAENQGPGSYTLTTVVNDNATPPLSATNSFAVTVFEVNRAPTLPAQADRIVNELSAMNVANPGSDPDFPANTLTYRLLDPPAGATIDAGGNISWTSTEEQGPGSYRLTTVATDSGTPPLSVTNSFSVTVQEVNSAPVVVPLINRFVQEGSVLTFTVSASDADLPANAFSFSLINPPSGASVNSAGVFTWLVPYGHYPTTNTLAVVVADNGVPSLGVTGYCQVVVNHMPQPANPVVSRTLFTGAKIPISTLLGSDPDGDSLHLESVDPLSQAGVPVTADAVWVYYQPSPGFATPDEVFCYISDGRGGVGEAVVSIAVRSETNTTSSIQVANLGNNNFRVRCAGIPNYQYRIETTASLTNPAWQFLRNQAASSFGIIEFIDAPPGGVARHYRAVPIARP